jgi:WD40 repeat protein
MCKSCNDRTQYELRNTQYELRNTQYELRNTHDASMTIDIKKITQLTGHQGSVYTLTDSMAPQSRLNRDFADAQYFLSGAGDGWVVEWDLAKPEVGKLLAKIETNIFALLFIKEKNLIVAGNRDGGIHFIDLNDPAQNKNVAHHNKGVFSIQLIDNQLITLGGEGSITRWSLDEKRTLESLQLSSKSLRCMDFSASRNEFAVGASDGNIYILDKNFDLKKIIKAHKNSVFTLKYAPDEPYLLSGGRDAMLNMWDVALDFKNISSLPAHLYTINDIAFHPTNPTLFATASRDKTIKIWHFNPQNLKNTEGPTLLKVLDTIRYGSHINSVNSLLWSPYNNYLLSASDDRSIIVWGIL